MPVSISILLLSALIPTRAKQEESTFPLLPQPLLFLLFHLPLLERAQFWNIVRPGAKCALHRRTAPPPRAGNGRRDDALAHPYIETGWREAAQGGGLLAG